jgi:group I intron endonuclease
MKNNNKNFIPVAVYENPEIHKDQIYSDNKIRAGIYRWINKVNGKSYVGSSNSLARRFREYFNLNYLERNKSMLICRALLKYGYSGFSLEILEYCELSERLERENHYFKLLKPEYNILKVAGSNLGHKHTEESRAKMAAWERSEEMKAKISVSMIGNSNGRNHPNSKKIEVTDLELDTKTTYSSFYAAAKALNINHGTILGYFRQNQQKPYKRRYIFSISKIDS